MLKANALKFRAIKSKFSFKVARIWWCQSELLGEFLTRKRAKRKIKKMMFKLKKNLRLLSRVKINFKIKSQVGALTFGGSQSLDLGCSRTPIKINFKISKVQSILLKNEILKLIKKS